MTVKRSRHAQFAAYVAVYRRDSGSFTAAAAAASGQTKAVVSFQYSAVERAWRNVTATFHPTTISQTPSPLPQKANLLNAVNLQDEVRASHYAGWAASYVLPPPEFGEQVVIPVLARLRQRHPDLRIRICPHHIMPI